jgi:hypothetical protein
MIEKVSMNAISENNLLVTKLGGSGCPFHEVANDERINSIRKLNDTDKLFFPMHRLAIAQYLENADGHTELFIFYGDREISFDEHELFPFGEQLVKQQTFAASEALGWGDGYTWSMIEPLLSELITQEILKYFDEVDEKQYEIKGKTPHALLTPSTNHQYEEWKDVERLSEKLTGKSIELGYLELVVPVFRVAHIALDQDGRQVGEANVFPSSLRVDASTEWRTCPYSGTRYMNDKPMNVTALKVMRDHWAQMMKTLLIIRAEYLKLYPLKDNVWTVAGVERLAVMVLSVPSYMLMCATEPVENGSLHPALSSMFRVTDGLRMTVHQMLFVPNIEPNKPPHTPITVDEIYAYAERNYSFHSGHGVCAGPQNMIEEFMRVLIDGDKQDIFMEVELDEPVKIALNHIKAAFNYGLSGLQAHFAAFCAWPAMTRAYAEISENLKKWNGPSSNELIVFSEKIEKIMHTLTTVTYHATEELRLARESTYSVLYAECNEALNRQIITISERTSVNPEEANALSQKLNEKLKKALKVEGQALQGLSEILAAYLLKTCALLDIACEAQQRVNEYLGRTQPKRDFQATDLDIHLLLQGLEARRVPQLIDELKSVVGIEVEVTKDRVKVN